jgi:hypothetical protein
VVILPGGAALVGVGEIEQAYFVEGAADELQSDRQAIPGKTTGYSDRWAACQIERLHEAP